MNIRRGVVDAAEFNTRILPQLAFHYRRQALNDLEGKRPWLKAFSSTQPDFSEARDSFFTDGSACILILQDHMKLMWLAIVNEELTCSFGMDYITFIANLDTAILGDGLVSKRLTEFTINALDSMAQGIQKAIGVCENTPTNQMFDPVYSFLKAGGLHPFLKAGRQMIVDRRARGTEPM